MGHGQKPPPPFTLHIDGLPPVTFTKIGELEMPGNEDREDVGETTMGAMLRHDPGEEAYAKEQDSINTLSKHLSELVFQQRVTSMREVRAMATRLRLYCRQHDLPYDHIIGFARILLGGH